LIAKVSARDDVQGFVVLHDVYFDTISIFKTESKIEPDMLIKLTLFMRDLHGFQNVTPGSA
jgi:hypothetical protein